jgi:ABC-2 type transport system permease protein
MQTAAPRGPVGFDASDDQLLIETGRRASGPLGRLADIVRHRQLLANLTRREISVRHRNSFLGLAWNLMNPLLYLVIFSFVFTLLLPGGPPRYALSLLSSLLIYDLFAAGVSGATASVVANSSLVTKIWFPREVLPVAAVAAQVVPFASRLAILGIGLAVFGQSPEWTMLWLMLPVVIITVALATGVGLILSALNVVYRDVQHFLELALLALFWFTPIVYGYDFVGQAIRERLGVEFERLAMVNPLTPLVVTAQRVLYNPTNFPDRADSFELVLRPTSWYLGNLAYAAAVAVVVLVAGLRVFARREGAFAERL